MTNISDLNEMCLKFTVTLLGCFTVQIKTRFYFALHSIFDVFCHQGLVNDGTEDYSTAVLVCKM